LKNKNESLTIALSRRDVYANEADLLNVALFGKIAKMQMSSLLKNKNFKELK
jgi:hypothetical protein